MRNDELQISGLALGLALGVIVGEPIAYFVALPRGLLSACIATERYGCDVTFLLRATCIALALATLPLFRRRPQGPRPVLTAPAGLAGCTAGALFMIGVGYLQQSGMLLGHVAYYERRAQQEAMQQLGAGYGRYEWFVRDLRQAFFPGRYVVATADVIGFDRETRDLREVPVSWKEPWTQ